MSLHCRCFVCHGEIEVADADIAKLVKCPHCGLSVNPAAMDKDLTALDAPKDRLTCVMSPEEAEAEARRRLLRAEAEIRKGADAALPATSATRGRRIRRLPVALALAGMGIAAGGIAVLAMKPPITGTADDEVWTFVLFMAGMLLGIPLLIVGLTGVVRDLRVPPQGERATPSAAIRCFMGRLLMGFYGQAYGCLLPLARGGEGRERPSVELLGLRPLQFSFATAEGFADYWMPIVRPSALHMRRPVLKRVEVSAQEGDCARVRFRLGLSKYTWKPGLALFGLLLGGLVGRIVVHTGSVDEQELFSEKLVRRVDGQWFLVNGEMDSPEDHAFAEAVRISKLSDSQLREELGQYAS